MRFTSFMSFRRIDSCKPDCPQRSPGCHSACEAYRRAQEKADEVAQKAKAKQFIDSVAAELKKKNPNRYGE